MKLKPPPNTGQRATFIFLAITVLGILFRLHQGLETTLSPIVNSNTVASSPVQHARRSVPFQDVSIASPFLAYSNSYNLSTAKVAIPFGDANLLDKVKHEKRKSSGVALTDEEWQERVDIGNNMLCLLSADVEGANHMFDMETQSDWLSSNDPSTYGWIFDERTPRPYEKQYVNSALQQLGVSTVEGDWHAVNALHMNEYQQGGVMEEPTQASYESLFCTKDRSNIAIIIKVMYSPRYMVEEVNMEGEVLPDLSTWSDLTFLSYYYSVLQAGNGGEDTISVPKHVFIDHIITTDTQNVVDEVVRRSNRESESWEWPGHVYDVQSDFGKAIMSTVHGKAVTWLFASHKHQFGQVAISKIHAFGTRIRLNLYFAMEDNAASANALSSEVAVRHPKRKEGTIEMTDKDWEDRLQEGNSFICLLAADIDGANRMLGTQTQSEWIFAEDFGDYGWTLVDKKEGGDKMIQYGDTLRTLGLSEDKHDWVQLSTLHEHRWTQDGVELPAIYRASFTEKNDVTAMLVKLMYSPKYQIEEEDEGEIPPHLQRWSDLTFLAYYYEFMDGSGDGQQKVPPPKYILMDTIDNGDTESVVKEVVKRSNTAVSAWPGSEYDTSDDFGKALLATVHGKAVSWLYASHKKQFGPATVSKITLFGKSSVQYSLLFTIEQVEQPAQPAQLLLNAVALNVTGNG